VPQPEEIIFKTPSGKYLAEKTEGVIKVKNIKYAFSERYKKPVALSETSQFGMQELEKTPVCPQSMSPLIDRMIEKIDVEKYRITESPQYLTITLPETSDEKSKFPVIVWIHGGSYEIGGGSVPTSNPNVWVKEQNIIFVSVTYRLGMFGFLGGYDERPANLGFYDLLEALKWIQTNISSFGGNPSQITLLGQSSGGDAIAQLLSLEEAKGLFKRVIIQSAPLGLRFRREKMSAFYSEATKSVKYSKDVLAMAEFQNKVAPKINKFGKKALMPFGVQYGFPPFAPESQIESLWKKQAKNVDVLVGYNADETALYLKTWESATRFKKHRWTRNILDKAVRYSTENIYGKPSREFAQLFANAGSKVYHFKLKAFSTIHDLGASHCIDLPLLFADRKAWLHAELLKEISWDEVFETGKILRKVWADFARFGEIYNTETIPGFLELKQLK